MDNTHQGPSGTKLPMLDMFRSIIIKYNNIKCGVSTHSAKETGQQTE